jgi:tetratricopeptide (TPR) repeat protein
MVDAEQYDAALELAENPRVRSVNPRGFGRGTSPIRTARGSNNDAAYQQYERRWATTTTKRRTSWAARRSQRLRISLYFDGRHEQAEKVHREVLEIYTRESHPRTRAFLRFAQPGISLIGQSRLQEAVGLLQQAYQMSVELHGAEHIDTLLEQATLGNLLMRLQQFDAAEALFRDNLAVLERVAPDMRVQRGAVHSYLGDVLLRTNRLPEARVEYLAAREFFAQLPEDNAGDRNAGAVGEPARMANAQP